MPATGNSSTKALGLYYTRDHAAPKDAIRANVPEWPSRKKDAEIMAWTTKGLHQIESRAVKHCPPL